MKIKVFSVLMIIFLAISIFMFLHVPKLYSTSLYSKYCYKKGTENHSMKTIIYYKSLRACGKPLYSK